MIASLRWLSQDLLYAQAKIREKNSITPLSSCCESSKVYTEGTCQKS